MPKQRMTSIEELEIRYAIPLINSMRTEYGVYFSVEDGQLYIIKEDKL